MKKLVSLLIVLVLLCSACASLGTLSTTTEKVCNFDVATSTEAQTAIAFISMASALVGPLTGLAITSTEAEVILNKVANATQTGACVVLTDLQNALTYFNALSAKYKAKGSKTPLVIPSLLNLRIKAKM
jgi:hypothetical protein